MCRDCVIYFVDGWLIEILWDGKRRGKKRFIYISGKIYHAEIIAVVIIFAASEVLGFVLFF